MENTISFTSIKPAVMRRVYGIWFVKKALPWLALEGVAVYIVLQQLAEHVFVNHVLANAALHTFARTPIAFAQYFMQALLNTDMVVQILIALSAVCLVLLARQMSRLVRFG